MCPAQEPRDVFNDYARTLIRVKARQLARRPEFRSSDRRDIEQELWLYLLSQAENFDPRRSSINTFIARVVDSAVAMLVRERRRAKRNPAADADVKSLAEMVPQPDGPAEPLARLISQHDIERRTGGASLTDAQLFELADDVASVIPTLPPELQAVCRSLLVRSRNETEAELGLTRRGLQAAIAVIREYFEKSNLTKN